jgi:hypothetical protein
VSALGGQVNAQTGVPGSSAAGCLIEVYKDYPAWWGDNTDEEILPQLGYVRGAPNGYDVQPTSALQDPIPPQTKLVLITSNSWGWQSTEDNVNHPTAQANLEAFVRGGGVLVIHMGNNYLTTNFIAPGGTTVTQGEDAYTTQVHPAAAGHPVFLGPDGIAGTGDDLTPEILAEPLEFQTHGVLNLPAGATQILLSPSGLPVLGEYGLGRGWVVATTFTMELWHVSTNPAGRAFINEITYAIWRIPRPTPLGDTTPPTLTATCTPAPNALGWCSSNVTVTFMATDSGSGVASVTPPVTLSREGTNQKVTGTAKDRAGNSASLDVTGLNIDKTPPVITASVTPTSLWPPNGRLTPVVVSGQVSDSLSGLDLASASYTVVDNYGVIQPRGAITCAANGRFSVAFQLQAARNGNDIAGRQYAIQIQARDKAGNPCTAVVVVTAPHDQGKGK